MSESTNNPTTSPQKDSKGNIFGIIGLIVGVIAWLTLYRYEWGGLGCAIAGLILSIIGTKGRFKNMAVGGTILSGILLIVVGIVHLAIYFLFQSV